jgi:SET domain-containing protein
MTGLEIGPSALHGLGVFATRAFAAGDIIERCPVVVVPAAERPLLDETNLYNHSPLPCARYLKIFGADTVEFAAVRDIDSGHEITVDYTDRGRNPLWFPLQPPGLTSRRPRRAPPR